MKNKLIFIIILSLGFILRIYHLGNIPVGFHRDEAYLGYNAFSILQTGKDITGNLLPLHLESFLFSPAGYSYASIPFISLFGLNEFSVRLASALFGTVTILIVYLLVKKIFSKYSHKEALSLLASLFLAVSPWHINLSRVATENILVVFFISFGTLLFLHWNDKRKNYLLLTAFFCFGITLLIYQAPRAFLPVFIPMLIIIFNKSKKIANLFLPIALYILVILIPLFLVLSSHDLSQRIRMLSIFEHPGTQLILNEQIREDGSSGNTLITRIFHNKAINYASTFLQNYAKHLSYDFLFTDSGLPDRYRIPGMGLLYLTDLIYIIFGISKLLIKEKRIAVFLIGWILISFIGSALTFDDIPNLQRTVIVFPALSIITAYGFFEIWKILNNYKFKLILKCLLVIILFYNFLFYLHQYYVHQINHRPWFRQEGYEQLVAEVNRLLPGYRKVVITDAASAPEIFFLFYSTYDPNLIQKTLETAGWKSSHNNFGKYIFSNECPLHTDTRTDPVSQQIKTFIKAEKETLYVNYGECKTDEKFIREISQIRRPDQTVVFKIVVPK